MFYYLIQHQNAIWMRCLLCFLILFLTLVADSQNPKVNPLPLGSPAPQFDLPATDGKNYTLDDFKSYPVLVVIFTCNHCPTAQAYEERIINMVNEYQPKGVGFVAISPNDPDAISLSELGYSDLNDDLNDMKIRAREMNFNFPYLYDGKTQEVSIAYGPAATPHVFVFDHDRKLRYRGRIDDTENPYVEPRKQDMKDALDALLNGRVIAVPSTKTFGCSTKWAWKDNWVDKQREQWAEEPVNLDDLALEHLPELIKNNSDKLRFINIWASWCGPCLVEFPDLVDINRMYRNRDFEFITISTDKSGQKDKVLRLLKKFEASNQNYIYSGDNIYNLIEAVDPDWQGALPYSMLIAPGGKIIYKLQGPVEPFTLKKKIVNYLGRYYADEE